MSEQQAIVDLQTRLVHQEAAIDELTRLSLTQQRQIAELIEHVQRLQSQLRDLAQQGGHGDVLDAPPPHY
jgi:uncharacterized coiled-coil protein SlyX